MAPQPPTPFIVDSPSDCSETSESSCPGGVYRLEEGTQTDEDNSLALRLGYNPENAEDGPPPGTSDDGCEDIGVFDRLSRLFSPFSVSSRRRTRSTSTQTSKDPLASQTEKLAFDIIFYTLGRRRNSASDDDVMLTLRRSVSRMLEKHSYFFAGLMSRLQLRPGTDLKSGFVEVAGELFARDGITWAKIIALFAFGARLAKYFSDRRMENKVLDVASSLATFAVLNLTPFLKEQGGWIAVCDAFPNEEDYERKIWRSLLVTGLGLGAVATFLAMQH